MEKDPKSDLDKDTEKLNKEFSHLTRREKLEILEVVPENAKCATKFLETIEDNSHLSRINEPGQTIVNHFEIKPEKQPVCYEGDNCLFLREKDGTMLLNRKITAVQKKAVKSVIGKLAKKILTADLTGLNLPVFLFNHKTYLHQIAESFSFVLEILEKAALLKDPKAQFKSVIALMLAGVNHIMARKQPLNPILGETFNGFIGEKTTISLEQISHHPPVSAFYIEGNGFIYHGALEMKPSITLPYIYLSILGDSHVKFTETKNHFVYTQPYLRIKGIVTGSKRLIIEGHGQVFSPNESYLASIKFSPGGGGAKRWFGKPADRDEVKGEAFSCHPDTVQKFIKSKKKPRKDPGLKDGKKGNHSMFLISGRWSSEFQLGEDKYDVRNFKSYTVTNSTKMLPSDSTVRLDHLNLIIGNMEEAAVAKYKMETMQRKDRKLRKKFGPKKK